MKLAPSNSIILRIPARPVTRYGKKLGKLIKEMMKFLQKNDGVGLAAPQIGLPLQLAIAWVGEEVVVLINPVILDSTTDELITEEEGCLSLPGRRVKAERARHIHFASDNLKGDRVEAAASDYLARVIQHEIDHLQGRLIDDYEFLNLLKV